MKYLDVLFIPVFILGILFTLLSLISKSILYSNGYKVNWFITQFFGESKKLKEICKENKGYNYFLKSYIIVSYALFVSLIAFIVLFFLLPF